MRAAFCAVKLGSLHSSSTLAAQRASFSSGLPRLALAQQVLVAEASSNDLSKPSFVKPLSTRPPKSKAKPSKPSSLMPPPPQSSSRDGARARSGSYSNRRGGVRPPNKKNAAPLPEQLEGGMHDLAFVESAYSKDGTLKLQKKYMDTPKDQLQNYMRVVYAKTLDASYLEGHIGRTKMFRSAHQSNGLYMANACI